MENPFTWSGFARCLSVSFLLTIPVACIVLPQRLHDAQVRRTRQALRVQQLERHLQSQALKNADDAIQPPRPEYDPCGTCNTCRMSLKEITQ